jgi:undecaprenyl diphosphate synthase
MNKINHVAIIMDGNGRWALKRNKPRNFGHQEGLKNISSLIHFAKKNKIKFLTLFVFSLDNWKRSKKEVNFLFNLLEKFLDKNIDKLIKKKIKIKSIGERKKLSKKLINKIKKVEKLSSINYDITVNLAFNYSSKIEIIESFKKSIKQKKRISVDSIKTNLYTKNIPDPELLIRTGGQNRLSDFMLWQMSYTELFFLKKLWPDFNANDFKKILNEYRKIKRNFGSIND